MNCYICEKAPKRGGTHFGVRAAVGICHHCGIGICAEHSHKDGEPGSPLLCKTCAEIAKMHVDDLITQEVGDLFPA
jgi:hypothetical protein